MRGEAALPEELLRNILSYNLIIDPDTFLAFPRTGYPRWQAGQKDTGSRKHQAPAFHVLSVSKRWLRVGTPLLYECVTVATLEHTRRLADFLQKHPEVGKAIRHLRLEGGMGRELFQVARWVVGLQTLYVSLHVRASESVAGLAKALPVLKPRVLRLHGTGYNLPNVRQNNAYHEIYAALAMNIRFWPSLESVTLYPSFTMTSKMADALRNAPALREIRTEAWGGMREWVLNGHVRTIAGSTTLARIYCDCERAWAEAQDDVRFAMRSVNLPRSAERMVIFVDSPA